MALMVIEVVTLPSGISIEQDLHVLERGDRHADLADFAGGELVVGVAAHLGRQIKGDAQTGGAG